MAGAVLINDGLFTSGAPSGVCCCGSDMDDHSGWDNHSPLDQAHYGGNNNPVLIRLRDTMDAFESWENVLVNLADDEAIAYFMPAATDAHIKQAKRIIRKLAAVSSTTPEETP